MNRPGRSFTLTFFCLAAATLAACGGSGGGNPVIDTGPTTPPPASNPPPSPSAPDDPLLYLATEDDPGRVELFLIDPDSPGASSKVNATLAGGGNVTAYALSPDRTQAAYIADQETPGVAELYLVDLANPGTGTKVNSALVGGGDVIDFEFSPDSTQIAYVADQEADDRFEAWLVDLVSPGLSTRINGTLTPGGEVVDGILFSPDGTQLLYAADQDLFATFELYLVESSALGVSTKVHPPFTSDIELAAGFSFSPDGGTIAYMADQDIDGTRELYAVAVGSLGVSTKLNEPLVAGGDLCDFKFSPDSTHIAYCADQDTDGTLELYLVELAVPGVTPKLNSTLVAGGDVSAQSYAFDASGDFLVYRADQDTNGTQELYRVERAMPGTTVKVNDTLIADGDVAPASGEQPSFRISPDGLSVAYIADQETLDVFELYTVDLATPGVSTKLNPPMTGDGARLLDTTDDSLQVIYIAAQDSAAAELYRVDIAAPGVATTMSDSLVGGGEVVDFTIVPGFRSP